jgi:hypothetical protein
MLTINKQNSSLLPDSCFHLNDLACKKQLEDMLNGWPEVFRTQILPILPIDEAGKCYCPDNGPSHPIDSLTA